MTNRCRPNILERDAFFRTPTLGLERRGSGKIGARGAGVNALAFFVTAARAKAHPRWSE